MMAIETHSRCEAPTGQHSANAAIPTTPSYLPEPGAALTRKTLRTPL
jgi:hypothetical protein